MGYFAAEMEAALTATGLRPGRMAYFASRSAALGRVAPATTAATFYNFNPELVARHIPRAWTLAEPSAVIAARFEGAAAALRRLLGQAHASAEFAEFGALARASLIDLDPAGRPLYAAHAALSWPDDPVAVTWHALTLIREYRGDGHLAALLGAELSGIEAILTHTATGRGFLEPTAKRLRGWSDEQWQAAADGLVERGILAADGALTSSGVQLRADVEHATDRMAAKLWRTLGEGRTDRFIELGKAFSRTAVGNGAFPPGIFA
ncbi:SCO6745 family protein [Jatrophihabitans telluris]